MRKTTTLAVTVVILAAAASTFTYLLLNRKTVKVIGPAESLGNTDTLAVVNLGGDFLGKYGYIDKAGKYVINPQFEDAKPFKDGFAAVEVGRKWGYINKGGKFVINPQFDDAEPFNDGLAVVKVGGKYG
jgi:hypothetical protein